MEILSNLIMNIAYTEDNALEGIPRDGNIIEPMSWIGLGWARQRSVILPMDSYRSTGQEETIRYMAKSKTSGALTGTPRLRLYAPDDSSKRAATTQAAGNFPSDVGPTYALPNDKGIWLRKNRYSGQWAEYKVRWKRGKLVTKYMGVDTFVGLLPKSEWRKCYGKGTR